MLICRQRKKTLTSQPCALKANLHTGARKLRRYCLSKNNREELNWGKKGGKTIVEIQQYLVMWRVMTAEPFTGEV